MGVTTNKLIKQYDDLSVLIPSIRGNPAGRLTTIAIEKLHNFFPGRMSNRCRRLNKLILWLTCPISGVTLRRPVQSLNLRALNAVGEFPVLDATWVEVEPPLLDYSASHVSYGLSFTASRFHSHIRKACSSRPLIVKKFILNCLQGPERVSVPDAAKLSFEVSPYLLQVVFGRQRQPKFFICRYQLQISLPNRVLQFCFRELFGTTQLLEFPLPFFDNWLASLPCLVRVARIERLPPLASRLPRRSKPLLQIFGNGHPYIEIPAALTSDDIAGQAHLGNRVRF